MKGVVKTLGLVALLSAFSGVSGRANAQTYALSHRVSTCTPSVQYSQEKFFGLTVTKSHETVCVPYSVPKSVCIEDSCGNLHPGIMYEQHMVPVTEKRIVDVDYDIKNSLGAQVLRALADKCRVDTQKPVTICAPRPVITSAPYTFRHKTSSPITCAPATHRPAQLRDLYFRENDDGSWTEIKNLEGDLKDKDKIKIVQRYGPDGQRANVYVLKSETAWGASKD